MIARALAIEKQAQKLPATERERLAERLLVQMKHEPITAVDEAWITEAEKRFGAWKRKAAKTVSAGEALREIRRELRHGESASISPRSRKSTKLHCSMKIAGRGWDKSSWTRLNQPSNRFSNIPPCGAS